MSMYPLRRYKELEFPDLTSKYKPGSIFPPAELNIGRKSLTRMSKPMPTYAMAADDGLDLL